MLQAVEVYDYLVYVFCKVQAKEFIDQIKSGYRKILIN